MNSWFLWTRKKKSSKEKKKGKDKRPKTQKIQGPENEPKYELFKRNIVKKKGKKIKIQTFEGDFPLLVCGFARTRLISQTPKTQDPNH